LSSSADVSCRKWTKATISPLLVFIKLRSPEKVIFAYQMFVILCGL